MTNRRKNGEPFWDLKLCLFWICTAMAGYLLFLDREISVNAIWDNHLWLLAGLFIFGLFYEIEFFAISFWLLVVLGGTDLILGINLNLTGPSCWSGFMVWAMTLAAGFSGFLLSVFIPRDNLFFEGLKRRL